MKRKAREPVRIRPMPPDGLWRFQPAPEVKGWIFEQVLAEDGALHNPDHKHLLDADLEVLWAPEGFTRQGRTVVGQAEEVAFRAGGWQKARQEQQMREWFGRLPDFLITLDASYALRCSDVEWCALVEHELYHLAHLKDAFGAPAFTKDGRPKVGIKGHDVEEFVGVVRRYGVGAPESTLAQLVAAARKGAEVSDRAIAGGCGTCLRLVA